MAEIQYPQFARGRGPGFWLRPENLLSARQKIFRLDYSNEWRYSFGTTYPSDHSITVPDLIGSGHLPGDSYRFIVIGDTGEGDRSQYGLVPLIRALKPDFMIINGDIAYPAGRTTTNPDDDDFLNGFFKPYRNLGIPIWATPGNHEYYSNNNGRDCFDIFCTRKFDARWAEYGLRHEILQPGMFWELRDDSSSSGLVVIGIDTGKAANLDGHNDWWQFWKRKIEPDTIQHTWLDSRLRRAEEENDKVIVMFHIPALVRERHAEDYIKIIHCILTKYSCVQIVMCGHEHNYQYYTPSTFRNYVQNKQSQNPISRNDFPHYIVSGAGGAALASTNFSAGPFQSHVRYPNEEQWNKFSEIGRRIVSSLNLEKGLIGKLVARIEESAKDDGDVAMFLSFVLVEVNPKDVQKVTMTPVFMDDLENLFANYPAYEKIDVTREDLSIEPEKIEMCLKKEMSIKF